MSTIVSLVSTGMLFAFGYAVAPGIINAESTRRGLQHGFRPAFSVQAGALLGDIPWLLLAFTGGHLFLRHAGITTALGIVGSILLLWLARSSFLTALRPTSVQSAEAVRGNPLIVGCMLSLANPVAFGFWTGVGGGMLVSNKSEGVFGLVILVLAFIAGSLITRAGLAALASWAQTWTTGSIRRGIDGLGATVLTFAAANMLWGTLT